MAAAPEVVACYVISGRYDYLVRIACPHLAHYHGLINGWLDDASLGVEKIVTNIELQTIKEFAGFPVPRAVRRRCADAALQRRPTPLPFRKRAADIHAVAAARRASDSRPPQRGRL